MADLLSKAEIKKVISELKNLTAIVENIQKKSGPYSIFQFPKTPPTLTESIAYHLINDGKILQGKKFSKILFNEKATKHAGSRKMPTDLIGKIGNSGEFLIEVKGTRKPSQFTQFGQKDVDSDCIVWIDYGFSFQALGKIGIEVAVIENPRKAGLKAAKYTWDSASFSRVQSKKLRFSSFTDLLR